MIDCIYSPTKSVQRPEFHRVPQFPWHYIAGSSQTNTSCHGDRWPRFDWWLRGPSHPENTWNCLVSLLVFGKAMSWFCGKNMKKDHFIIIPSATLNSLRVLMLGLSLCLYFHCIRTAQNQRHCLHRGCKLQGFAWLRPHPTAAWWRRGALAGRWGRRCSRVMHEIYVQHASK